MMEICKICKIREVYFSKLSLCKECYNSPKEEQKPSEVKEKKIVDTVQKKDSPIPQHTAEKKQHDVEIDTLQAKIEKAEEADHEFHRPVTKEEFENFWQDLKKRILNYEGATRNPITNNGLPYSSTKNCMLGTFRFKDEKLIMEAGIVFDFGSPRKTKSLNIDQTLGFLRNTKILPTFYSRKLLEMREESDMHNKDIQNFSDMEIKMRLALLVYEYRYRKDNNDAQFDTENVKVTQEELYAYQDEVRRCSHCGIFPYVAWSEDESMCANCAVREGLVDPDQEWDT